MAKAKLKAVSAKPAAKSAKPTAKVAVKNAPDFKVKDITLADWGRKEIEIAQGTACVLEGMAQVSDGRKAPCSE